MTQRYKEQDFEEHVTAHLLASGYRQQPPSAYDRDLCLIPSEVVSFIQATQPEAYEKLERQYGPQTPQKLCQRLRGKIARYGTLYVLRKGVSDRGASFDLVYYKPSSGMNPRHWDLYRKNRFAVVRQLRFSARSEKSLDLVLFLNGLPIATAELKNALTGQFVAEAKKQYRKDRDPKEPLFQFKRTLVHFAVGNENAFMTTRLAGASTYFLPFNKGIENPVNPDGHKTAYLWDDLWQPDTLLNLLQNYLHVETSTEKVFDPKQEAVVERSNEILIFPRFHQLDAVRTLLAAAKAEGPGHNYLVQHSAGSGKSNSIAWLAHQLAKLYRDDAAQVRLFDSVVVITDRRVLDRQLQDTIKQAEKVPGRVTKIDKHSDQLRAALEKGKDIIVTTLQKFPVISDAISALDGQRFAVIIDEAHSSQAGEQAKHLKKALSANLEDAEAEDDEFDAEEAVLREIRTRGRQRHISYFAFTATPKDKMLELFGRKNAAGQPTAFHTYSMRQAIEEGFILDVLKHYTTFKRYFKLVRSTGEDDEYEQGKAVRLLTSYVDLQPHAIDVKAQIMLDYFVDVTADALQGRGRAMLVTRSRLHCVKYFLKFKKLIQERGLPFQPLVAFSGTVRDPDTGAEHTETSLNALGSRTSIKEAFKLPTYRLLIVANKFQTGFDEPLLHTMYVDKKLGGVSAVQTLSRLNRKIRGKTDTVVLDFVNDTETIQTAFQRYYQATILEEETDPNKLYDLRTELDQFDLFTEEDVDDFAAVFFNPREPGEKLQPLLDDVVQRWRHREPDEREDFRSALQRYSRLYGYIAQLVSFEDAQLEKLYVFARNLNRKLPRREGHLPEEIIDHIDLDSFRIQETYSGSIGLEREDAEIAGITSGVGLAREEQKAYLSSIVQHLNDTYGVDLTEEDKVDLERMQQKLNDDDDLKAVVNPHNSTGNMRYKFDERVDELLIEFLDSKLGLYTKLNKPSVNEALKRKWFERFYRKHSGQ